MTCPLDRLLAIMAQLRDQERGCPWDRAQDFATIAPYTIEEAYEALLRSAKIQRRAARLGFDWPDATGVFVKIEEEIAELKSELARNADPATLEDEMGDILFAIANLARKLEIEPEAALRRATAKFERRFRRVEVLAGERAIGADLDALEALWQQVKREER